MFFSTWIDLLATGVVGSVIAVRLSATRADGFTTGFCVEISRDFACCAPFSRVLLATSPSTSRVGLLLCVVPPMSLVRIAAEESIFLPPLLFAAFGAAFVANAAVDREDVALAEALPWVLVLARATALLAVLLFAATFTVDLAADLATLFTAAALLTAVSAVFAALFADLLALGFVVFATAFRDALLGRSALLLDIADSVLSRALLVDPVFELADSLFVLAALFFAAAPRRWADFVLLPTFLIDGIRVILPCRPALETGLTLRRPLAIAIPPHLHGRFASATWRKLKRADPKLGRKRFFDRP